MAKDPYERFQFPTPDVQLEIKQNLLTARRMLHITGEAVTYDGKVMHFKDIAAIRFGMWSPQKGVDYFFIFKEKSGGEMTVSWNSIGPGVDASEAVYKRIDDKLMETFGLATMRNFHSTLKAGNEIRLKFCRATREGLHYEKRRWFSKRPIFVPWESLGTAKGYLIGHIVIGHRRDKDTHQDIIPGGEWNLQYLLRYAEQLRVIPGMMAELKG